MREMSLLITIRFIRSDKSSLQILLYYILYYVPLFFFTILKVNGLKCNRYTKRFVYRGYVIATKNRRVHTFIFRLKVM